MKIIFWIILACLLASCGEDFLAERTDASLVQKVYILPLNTNISNDKLIFFEVGDTIYLEANQTYKFHAGFLLDGEIVDDDSKLRTSLLWNIDGQSFNISTFQYAFSTPGEKSGYLESVDFYGDTNRINLTFLVNTPNKIELISPSDGYNQAGRDDDQGLPLRWKINGLDPWETASCTIFASDYEEDIWVSSLGSVDCNNPISLKGYVDEDKRSNTVYWAIVMQVYSNSGKYYTDSSSIYSFSTKTKGKSYLTFPIDYKRLPYDRQVNTEIVLLNAAGDTLRTLTNRQNNNVLEISVPAQTGLQIHARDLERPEYTANIQTVDIPQNTLVSAEAITFTDKVPPQLEPKRTKIFKDEDICFTVSDKGSEINPQKLRVIVKKDTIDHSYSINTLSFANPCQESCRIFIEGEDNAQNPLPKVYWEMERILDITYITGPFPREDF